MSNDVETHALAMPRDLGPAVLAQLDSEAVKAYRLSYRMLRMRDSKGSRGEEPHQALCRMMVIS